MALFVLVALAALLLLGAAWMGAFHRVEVAERDCGPFTFVYLPIAAGEMGQVGAITTRIDAALEAAGVRARKPLDVFYPDGTGEIGFAVEGTTPAQLAALPDKTADRTIPAQRCMAVEFPWRNRLSFMVGYVKVDPALAAWRAAHGYRKVEAMALNDGGTILYLQPIVRQ